MGIGHWALGIGHWALGEWQEERFWNSPAIGSQAPPFMDGEQLSMSVDTRSAIGY
ncbi:hypothetical protein [aff. Roholtiella sp. LEGE 12411]|uniref:hypothetical protein n=1 Tax=aff. Roholtiella sp. LEGE 12411 TaxID=1828822 RepID=UPI0018830605|nr:hypothetical protein [aff. Roholtiella sp. LEGE 12411]